MASLIETHISGRYILQQKLGEGGMGAVYRATDRLTQETVALKRVTVPGEKLQFAARASLGKSDDFRLALAQEFKTLASLRHPHIISVLDYGFDAQRHPFLTMELLEDAPNLIVAGRELPRPQQIELLVQLLQALAYLHRRGIIHRDLKPDNVLVVEGQVKVLDFGLAVAREHLSREKAGIYGTPTYMAPEVLEGQPAGEASDLYAVGLMAFELFAGRHPFNTTNLALLMMDIVKTVPDTGVLGLDDQLAEILDKLLAKNPQERYSDARELINLYAQATNQPDLMVETSSIRESYLQAAQFVGREAEFGQLVAALTAAKTGQGSAWLVGGESGVGKSRLLEELRIQALVEGALVLPGQAISEGGIPYQVWQEMLRRLCLEGELTDLEAGVLKMLIPDIGRLLGREVPEAPPLAPTAAYKRLLKVMLELFQKQRQPLVVILEDMQWVGDESTGLLSHLTQHIEDMSVLVLASYRDDERPHLPAVLPFMESLTLPRLTGAEIAALSGSMLGPAGREAAFLEFLQQETEGNTFFIVEVIRSLAEEVGRLDQIARMDLPQSISAEGMQLVIERRLAQAGSKVRVLLPVAAVAGRQLDLDLLRHLAPEVNVEAWLNWCAEAGVLEVYEGQWRFAHDRLREAVILDLTPEVQKGLHRQVAEGLEQVYETGLSPYYPRLAHHWHQVAEICGADLAATGQAIEYLHKAGEQAGQSSANQEAISYFNQALTLLKLLPATPERIQQEMTLLLALSGPLTRLKGYSAPEVEQIYTQAWELGRQVGETPELFPVLRGLWDYYLTRTEGYKAHELGQQLLDLARRAEDRNLSMEAHWLLGETLFFMGEISAALKHQEEAIARYDPQQYRAYPYRAVQDPGLASRYFRASTLWVLGYPDQALTSIHDTLTLAQELAQPFELANTLYFVIEICRFRREVQAAQAHLEQFITLSTQQGFEMWVPIGNVQRGWALAEQGQVGEGIAQMVAGLDIMVDELGLLNSADALAEAYVKVGRAEEGLALLVDTFDAVDRSGYRLREAELYRLKGELLYVQDADESEIESCFRQAIDIARRQQSKSWELRATVSLSRLLQKQGQPAEARHILAKIYSWFSEGFDTADLKEAKALLEELS